MVLSMGAVLIVVVALLAVTYRQHSQVVYPVDYPGTVARAVAQAPFTVLVPAALPADMKATVARYEPESLGRSGDVRMYAGFTTDSGGFVSVWQSNGNAVEVIANATNSETCRPEGAEWTRCEVERPLTRSLVRVSDGVIVVVSGTLEWDLITAFAESLQPASE